PPAAVGQHEVAMLTEATSPRLSTFLTRRLVAGCADRAVCASIHDRARRRPTALCPKNRLLRQWIAAFPTGCFGGICQSSSGDDSRRPGIFSECGSRVVLLRR